MAEERVQESWVQREQDRWLRELRAEQAAFYAEADRQRRI